MDQATEATSGADAPTPQLAVRLPAPNTEEQWAIADGRSGYLQFANLIPLLSFRDATAQE